MRLLKVAWSVALAFVVILGLAAGSASAAQCSSGADFCAPDGNVSFQLTSNGGGCNWTVTVNWGDGKSSTYTFTTSTTASHQYGSTKVFHGSLQDSGTSSDPNTTCVPGSQTFTVEVPADFSYVQNTGCKLPPCTRITQSRQKQLLTLKTGLQNLAVAGGVQAAIGGSLGKLFGKSPLGGAILKPWEEVNKYGALSAGAMATKIDHELNSSVVVPDGTPNAIGPKGEAPPGSRGPSRDTARRGSTALKSLIKNLKQTADIQTALFSELDNGSRDLAHGNLAGYAVNASIAQQDAAQLRSLLLSQIKLRHQAARQLSPLHLPHLSAHQARALRKAAKRGTIPHWLKGPALKPRLHVNPAQLASYIAAASISELRAPLSKAVASKRILGALKAEADQLAAIAAAR